MSKEKVLYQNGKESVGITEEGNYYEAYGVSHKNILRGAGLYIQDLNQTITLQQKVIELMAESLSYYQNITLERGEKHKISAEWLLNYYTQKAKENI